MDLLCTRCARLSLQRGVLRSSTSHPALLRSFSSSTRCGEEAGSRPSSGPPPGAKLLRPTRPPRDPNAVRTNTPRQQPVGSAPRQFQGQRPTGQLLQRAHPQRSGPNRRGPRGGRASGRGGFRDDGPPVRVRYADGTEAEIPVSQVLRPNKGAQMPEYVLEQDEEAASGQDDALNSNQVGEEREPTDTDINDFIVKHVDRPANPTEPIPYQPASQSHLDLQQDWPDTPMSSTGLTASVVQKMEFLARRIPHGYQTPEQIAEHFQKGNLTRFESEEEKQQVLKIAQELAKKRADQLTQRKGEQVEPVDMSLSDLNGSKEDKQALMDSMVRGELGQASKQRMPFLDSIVRNLQNNQTYQKSEMDKFMAKVESLIPAQATTRRAAARPGQK